MRRMRCSGVSVGPKASEVAVSGRVADGREARTVGQGDQETPVRADLTLILADEVADPIRVLLVGELLGKFDYRGKQMTGDRGIESVLDHDVSVPLPESKLLGR